jgi:hypothetical protein
MLWLPAARVDTVSDAVPLLRLAVPRDVAPSLNVTTPKGTPPLELVAAVRTTAAPSTAGLGLTVNAVVVALRDGGGVVVVLDPPQPLMTHKTARREDTKAVDRRVILAAGNPNYFAPKIISSV